ncbi:response regulator [Gottfriedia acidiceleris]|uniref:GGDEF domain-containing response regulator n=1 Tax=Gottfriedia acidiceleris TaxID=371036 RepID=UPI00101D5A19|nr:response regulator [Gottfriedia acidiceleris]
MIDIQTEYPIVMFIGSEEKSNYKNFCDVNNYHYKLVKPNQNNSALFEKIDLFNPDVLIIFIEEILNTFNIERFNQLRDFCERRYISTICICNTTDQMTMSALMPDAVLSESVAGIEIRKYINKFVQRRNQILEQVLIDPMTGVYNFRYLKNEVKKQLEDLNRSYESFSLVYVKIEQKQDYFLNHLTEKSIIQFLKRSLRSSDFLAHYKKNGFVLLLPKTVKEDGIILMNRLSQSFSEVPISFDNRIHYTSFNFNVLEITDPSICADDCLTILTSNEMDSMNRFDSSASKNENMIRRLKVAVINEDRLIREMLKHQLSDLGGNLYDVEIKVFIDGEEFLNDPWHKQNERYLLIIDRILPKMGGFEIIRKMRTTYDRRKYLCLMIGNKSSENDIAIALQSGANDYLEKPFSLKELRLRLNRMLGIIVK